MQLLWKSLELKKLHVELLNGPASPTSRYMPKRTENKDLNRYSSPIIHSGIIHNSQKVETTQISISRWMNKQNVVYPLFTWSNEVTRTAPAKMGLHEISRELQLRVCNQGQPHASALRVRGAELFYWGEKEGGERRDRGSRVRGFWLAESLSGKKTVFFLPFGLAFQGLGAPYSGLLTLI